MAEIIKLAQAHQYSLNQVGGKARNLGRLLQAGFDVPGGFVVTPGAAPEDILPHLRNGLWAVRSSAASEDSANRSFAGQHESYLNTPISEVPDKITACRQSVQSQAAQAYRSGQAAGQMAVIVQQMVAPQASGVAFTMDPTNGDREHLWVELTAGTGEALVGGTAAPQSLRIPRETTDSFWEGLAIPVGIPIPLEDIAALARLLLQVEAHFNDPQDIEWAYQHGKFWLLQSRPITTSTLGWTRANIGEVMPGVVTPLTWSVFRTHVTGQPDGNEQALRLINGRAYLNKAMLIRSFQWLVWADAETVSKALGVETTEFEHRLSLLEWGASGLFLLEVLGITRRLQGRVRRFTALAPPSTATENLEPEELLNLISAWDAWTAQAFGLHLYTTTYAVGAYGLLARQIQRHDPDNAENLETAILMQLALSQSGEIGRRLQELAAKALELGLTAEAPLRENPDFAAALDEFMVEFGARAVEEFELNTPRWREDPAPVLALIRRYMQQPAPSAIRKQKPPITRNRRIKRFQAGYTRFVSLREAMKHEVIRGYGALRQLYLALGAELAAQDIITKRDDIFFLTKAEIAAYQPEHDLRTTIRIRQAQWQRQHQPVTTRPVLARSTAKAALSGIPCSRGQAEGRARVVHSFDAGLTVQPDEILVVPQADPAWTPLFLCAAGVVAEVGGFLSHSATVAREFGVPAVFNVTGATQQIVTGQHLRVDGTCGNVEFLE